MGGRSISARIATIGVVPEGRGDAVRYNVTFVLDGSSEGEPGMTVDVAVVLTT